MPRRRRRVPLVVDVRRHEHDPVLARGRVVELLLEHVVDRLPRARLDDERVAERLDVERLAVRHLARLPRRRRVWSNSRPARTPPEFMNAATAPPKSVGAVASSMRVGDHVAHRLLDPRRSSRRRVAARADVRRDRCRPRGSRAEPRASCTWSRIAVSAAILRDVLRHDDVLGLGRDDLLRLVVDPRSMSVIRRPNDARARHELAADLTDVRLVRVRADHDLDARIEAVRDRRDLAPAEVDALVDVDVRVRIRPARETPGPAAGSGSRPGGARTTNALTPCSLRSFSTSALTVATSGRNSRPATADGVTIVGVPSSVRPMNAIFALSIFLTS